MEAREQKTKTITIRITPSLKMLADARAKSLNRSLTNYLEKLIENDVLEIKPRHGSKT